MGSLQLPLISILTANPGLCFFGSLTLALLVTIVRRIFFHPLSRYPGPFLGKFSDFWTYYGVFTKKRTMVQYEMLQKYGSPCRISTNELTYSDPQSIGDIYGQSSQPCLKLPALYAPFSVTGARNVFNTLDRVEHSRLRRLLANGFAARSLLEKEHLFMDKINEYIDLVYRGKEGQTIDIYEPTNFLYLDIISFLSFGKSLDSLGGMNRQVKTDLELFVRIMTAKSMAPGMEYLPIKYIQEALKGAGRLGDYSIARINSYLQNVSGISEEKLSKEQAEDLEQSLLYRLVVSKDAETGTSLSQLELAEHAILFLSAGSGTTAAGLVWLLWQVGQCPAIQSRLMKEIRAAFPDKSVSPTYAECLKVPYLLHTIEESLRLWGPLSSSGPRVSPGKVIGGQYVPTGVVVSSNPYATARDPTVFPEPNEFNPSRWEKATSAMRLMNRPFSSGPRNCIGRHLAEITFTLTVARLYQLYDIVPDPSMTEKVMQIQDNGPCQPWEERLLLTATHAIT